MLVDSHCHLDFADFGEDRDQLIERARLAGVLHMVSISTRISTFPSLLSLVEAYPEVSCSVGIHPNHTSEEAPISADELVRLSAHPKVVAIGEAGLDYHHDTARPEDQASGFREHIKAARETGLPLVIHARSADDDMVDMLEEAHRRDGAFPGILHCFSSTPRLAERGLALGLYLSFSGIVTFKNASDIQAVAASAPADKILVETDAPYLAPPPHRGKRNEPAFVIETAKKLAELRGVSFKDISKLTTDNFYRLFQKLTPLRRPEIF